jgi:hypothetical protein
MLGDSKSAPMPEADEATLLRFVPGARPVGGYLVRGSSKDAEFLQ